MKCENFKKVVCIKAPINSFHNKTRMLGQIIYEGIRQIHPISVQRIWKLCVTQLKIATWLKGTDREVSLITTQLSTYG